MVSSMTAFAHHETQNWVWELRSLNHRFLDLHFNLPTQFLQLEPDLRSATNDVLSRGRLDATLTQNLNANTTASSINELELTRLIETTKSIEDCLSKKDNGISQQTIEPLRLIDILKWPGVFDTSTTISTTLRDEICGGFSMALTNLVQSRQHEGNSLRELFEARLSDIREILETLTGFSDRQVSHIQSKLQLRLEKMPNTVQPDRLAQEVAMIAQRSDITEEIDRLFVHVNEFASCLTQSESLGRRLSFIVQEMARESNTVAAKLVVPEAITLSVDLKVLTDQIREQVQNVE